MYRSLQAMRAIAALSVVFFHIGNTIAKEKFFGIAEFSLPFSFGGLFGVGFFFVLSGFIITHVHRNDISNPGRLLTYVKKRLVRIYPTYWLIFFPVFIATLIIPSLNELAPANTLILIKSLLLLPQDSNVVGGTGSPVLIVAWSLQYEICFYIFFAIFIVSRALGFFIAMSVPVLYLYYGESAPFFLKFLTSKYVLLFLMGMCVSFIGSSGRYNVRRPLLWVGAGAFAIGLLWLNRIWGGDELDGYRIILLGLACSVLVFGLIRAEDKGLTIGSSKWLQIIGGASYVLYLAHSPIISFFSRLSVALGITELGVLGAFMVYFLMLFTSIIVSIAIYLWIEKPLLQYFGRRRRTFRPVEE